MTAHQPKNERRVFHVPKGVAYAVENSRLGIWFANVLRFLWIDMDIHVTKDGVIVCGHWGLIVRDLFVLPDWFIAKYGEHARIERVLWSDLKQLHTMRLGWRGRKRRLVYISAEQAMRTVARSSKRLGIAFEMKGSRAFYWPATFTALEEARVAAGLPKSRVRVTTLSRGVLGAPEHALALAKAEGFTTVVQARGPIPVSWEPAIDYVRGKWTRTAA